MSRYYVGDFAEGVFTEESRGWFDFSSNCYAMQSFEHEGRRISIGWISDFYGEHLEVENGVCGSMTIPREMHIRDNRLYLTPVKEMEALKSGRLKLASAEITPTSVTLGLSKPFAIICVPTNMSISLR